MSQRHAGKLVLWDDDRGYGFIESDGIRGRVFAHIRDFDRRAGRPMPGDDVTFHLVPAVKASLPPGRSSCCPPARAL
jgi:cold shock CspA family protein